MQKIFLISLVAILFAGCSTNSPALTKTRLDSPASPTSLGGIESKRARYSQILSAVVCDAVKILNTENRLKDGAAIATELSSALTKKLVEEKISTDDWNAAEANLLAPGEREKLVKLDFTNCLIGL